MTHQLREPAVESRGVESRGPDPYVAKLVFHATPLSWL